jgi:hypothetical protein
VSTANHSKTEDLLVSLAETVGSTLGTIAAKTNAAADSAQKLFSKSDVTGTIQREGKKLVRRTKKLAGSVSKKAKPRATVRRPVKRAKRAATRVKRAVAHRAKVVARRAKSTVGSKSTRRRANSAKTRA